MIKDKIIEFAFWEQAEVKEWKEINYPWKPDSKELREIDKVLSSLEISSRVALLGSTPEIRKLAARKKIKLDVIDFSEKMYIEMDKICKSKNNESFIKSDWIKYFSGVNDNYDLVIGDLIERLLPKNEVILLSRALKNALKQNGRVLLRSDYYISKLSSEKDDLSREVNRLKRMKLKDGEIVDWLFFYLSTNFKNKVNLVLLKKIRDFLEVVLVGNKVVGNNNVIQKFIKKWTYSPLNFYCRSVEDIESIWKRNFNVDAKIERQLFEGRLMALRLWRRKE